MVLVLCLANASAFAATYALSVSANSNRTGGVALDGATLAGNEYIFTSLASALSNFTPSGISRVCYWLDNTNAIGTATRCDTKSPYDYIGSVTGSPNAAAKPWNTALAPNGTHTITQVVTLSAGGTETDTATFTIANAPPSLQSLSLNPGTVSGGQSSTATITLTGVAPVGGAAVSVSSDSNSAQVPASGTVTVPAGSTSTTFQITTSAVNSVTQATISANYNNGTKTAVLTINPPGTATYALSVSTQSNRSGGIALDGATLAGNAYVFTSLASQLTNFNPTGITQVCFWLDNASMSGAATHCESAVPYDYVSSASTTTANPWNTTAVANGTHTITQLVSLSAGGAETDTATFTVSNAGLSLQALSLNPTTVGGGQASTATVTLTSAAPAGGAAVSVSSNDPAAQVPQSGTATVPAGSTSTNFQVTTSSVNSVTQATISANFNNITKTAVLTINPPGTGTYALSVSTQADRSGGVGLQGATLSGNVYVFTSLASQLANFNPTGISSVCFWQDNTNASGAATHCESAVPYDFASSVSTATAFPWNSASLPNGAHTITQVVTKSVGGTELDTASFSIQNLAATFSANPNSISPGQSTTLTWNTSNATTVTIDHGIGTVAAAGSIGVTPSDTTTYTLTASGPSGVISRLAMVVVSSGPPSLDVTMFHNDQGGTGQYLVETVLTPANVNSSSFGKRGLYPVDGRVDAQPLYLSALAVGGVQHNVLYAVTEHDSVYAFDADTGTQLWHSSVLPAGEIPSDDRFCFQISPEIGITATPVIDRSRGPNGAIYVVAMSKDGAGKYHHRLHALDITTGAELFGGPTEIVATYPGTGDNSANGIVTFDPAKYSMRSGVLLLNGKLYTTFRSHCDSRPYTGWVIAYDAGTLARTNVLNLTPNGNEGAIWMSGAAPTVDDSGNIYLINGNGTFDATLDGNGFPNKQDFGNALIRLSTAGGGLSVADYFTMHNTVTESNNDQDFGSGGALVLPDQIDSNGLAHRLVLGAGKDGLLYVLNRDNLGKFNSTTDNVYQEMAGVFPGGGIYSMPAYFNGVLYYGAVASPIKSFQINNARVSPFQQTATSFVFPGATPSISANVTSNAILWAVENNSTAAVLHAYDANDLTHELYNSNQAGSRDNFGPGNKFITPTIANGKVFVGTPTAVAVFGLLP